MTQDDDRPMIDAARRVAAGLLAPAAAGRDRAGLYPLAEMQELGRLGFLGAGTSPEWGGAGVAAETLATVIEELSAADASVGVLVSLHNSLVCKPVEDHGTRAQKERFLRPLAAGELLGAVSITEGQSGSDAADIRLRARPDGSGWRLDGAKELVTGGSDAGLVVMLAQVDGAEGAGGPTCFLVPGDTPGFRVARIEDKLGITASGTAALRLEDVRLGPEHLLGGVGEGLRILMAALARSRIGIAAQAVGIARAAFDAACAYARERESFGQPIIRHQAVGHRLADMATEIEAARQLTRHAARLADAGQPFQQASSMAKLFAGEMAERVTSDALQTFGGLGYLRSCAAERHFRDARVCKIYEGTADIQRMVIARTLARGNAG